MEKVDLSSCIKNSVKFQNAMEKRRTDIKNGMITMAVSEETKKKIKESLTKYYENNENKPISEKHREAVRKRLSKPVVQYNKNGELIKEYSSIIEADRISGVKRSNIHNSITGKTKTAGGGFIWKYKNSDIPIKSTNNALKTQS
jgi:hypothetical protein